MQLAQYFARLSDRNRGLTLFLSEISRSVHIKGVTYKSNTTLHVATGAAFFTTYCSSLAGEIFNDKWQACEQTKGNGLW